MLGVAQPVRRCCATSRKTPQPASSSACLSGPGPSTSRSIAWRSRRTEVCNSGYRGSRSTGSRRSPSPSCAVRSSGAHIARWVAALTAKKAPRVDRVARRASQWIRTPNSRRPSGLNRRKLICSAFPRKRHRRNQVDECGRLSRVCQIDSC